MNTIAIKNYPIASPGLRDKNFYLWSAVAVLGNLALPQLCHLATLGGPTWLPIYFCTLLIAARYGWKVGALTAVLSPVLNYAIFAMPAAEALPVIIVKSLFIAALAPLLVRRFGVSLLALALTIAGYQILGGVFETLTVSAGAALADTQLGWPGLLTQLFGGWLALRLWGKLSQ
ncbi:MAG: hypothetical protein LBK60_11210 [Verrucomicrobiales bacterium]|jgi:hypothetical protein|nr:hypothetical protein [Verrucomicrobiales bacterium]